MLQNGHVQVLNMAMSDVHRVTQNEHYSRVSYKEMKKTDLISFANNERRTNFELWVVRIFIQWVIMLNQSTKT